MLERLLKLEEIRDDSLFLWGSRQTGKSTLLKALFPNERLYDLLKTDIRMQLQMKPSLLREECEMLDEGTIVIIDEIQKVPALLDEVHWLMENRRGCGTSEKRGMLILFSGQNYQSESQSVLLLSQLSPLSQS